MKYFTFKTPILFTTLLFSFIYTKAQPDTSLQTTPWPEWVFHHWVWEDESTQQSATNLVDDYIQNGIPVGAIIIDSPWETGYNTFEFDTTLYPDPQGMIDYLHSKDVRILMWITGIINIDEPTLFNYAKTNNYFMRKDAQDDSTLVKWWKGEGRLIDFYNPAAVTWWKGLMQKTLDLGIDGWKCDGTDYSVVSTPYSPYLGKNVNRLNYSYTYYDLFFNTTREVLGKDRIITARPIDNYGFDIGDSSLAAFSRVETSFAAWVGDQDGTFEGLGKALNNMYHSDQMNYFSFGSDIGGYRDDPKSPLGRSKEVFIRWAQMGSLCPFMENGGSGEHRPWAFDSETRDIYKKFTKLHYDLIPYLMEEGKKAWNGKHSIMQFESKSDYSYKLGSELFVTPFLVSGTSINVNFPTGDDWVYVFDSTKVYTGGSSQSLTFPLDEFPVFVKKGSKLFYDIVASIDNHNTNFRVDLFPNPSTGDISITLPKSTNYSITLTDLTGRVVRMENVINTSSYLLKRNELANGVYNLTVSTNTETFTKKVILQ